MIKRNILIGILVVWFVFSTAYISWIFAKKASDKIFLNGYKAAVAEVADQAENENCYPFPIFLEGKTIELINIACLEIDNMDQQELTE
ncbi:MAG: hypothetical protein WBK67_04295 [Minisyncoccales bacterium]|jgi:hypothetical protein